MSIESIRDEIVFDDGTMTYPDAEPMSPEEWEFFHWGLRQLVARVQRARGFDPDEE